MKLRGWIFGTVLCLVLIKPLILILVLGVPIFFADEWSLVPFIEKVWHGQANFQDYWTALAEHRIFIPRLIFALIYRPGIVDPRQIMLISWLIMSWAYALAIWYFFLKRTKLAGSAKFLYAFCFLSLGLSLVQYENWLWALQLHFFLTQVFVILAAILIGIDSIGNGTKSLLIALCAAGASMCTGQGMLLWLSGGLCAFLIARTWVSRGLLAFSFLCGMALFVWFYHADGSGQLGQSSRLFWILHSPLQGLHSYFGLVGNPLTFCFGFARLKQAPIVGVVLVMLFACQVIVVLKRKLLQRSIPFILLGSFGLFYCGLVTLGRSGNGPINEWFLTSRYATNSLSIPLALVGLSFVIAVFSQRQDRSIEIDLLLCNVPLFLVFALCFASEVQAIGWASGDSSMRRFTAGLLPFFTLFDGATDGVSTGPFYPLCPVDNSKLISWAILPAMKVGFIPGPRDITVTPLADFGVQVETDVKRKTVLYLSHHTDPRVVEGWVQIPERITPHAILLRKPGEEKFLTAAKLEKEKGSEKGLFKYRWQFLILPVLDPDPGARFEAALLDEKEAMLFPLGNTL
ncbi:MAG TPA: hypothetical protein VK673_09265 [Chthoniobacterales bacterium]|nr:hypothetical protein [Chthoniobacterales bacterium]